MYNIEETITHTVSNYDNNLTVIHHLITFKKSTFLLKYYKHLSENIIDMTAFD